MYDGTITSVRTQGEVTEDSPIKIGLHQGSSLSHYLFTLVLNVLIEHIQDDVPKCKLFVDDIIVKTKYMKYKFNKSKQIII